MKSKCRNSASLIENEIPTPSMRRPEQSEGIFETEKQLIGPKCHDYNVFLAPTERAKVIEQEEELPPIFEERRSEEIFEKEKELIGPKCHDFKVFLAPTEKAKKIEQKEELPPIFGEKSARNRRKTSSRNEVHGDGKKEENNENKSRSPSKKRKRSRSRRRRLKQKKAPLLKKILKRNFVRKLRSLESEGKLEEEININMSDVDDIGYIQKLCHDAKISVQLTNVLSGKGNFPKLLT